MLFMDKHIPLIRSGEKTVTRRIWKDRKARPRPGGVYMAAAPMMVPDDYDHNSPMLLRKADCDCFIQIDDDYQREDAREPLGTITDVEAQREGDYETVEEFRESWIELHGEWDPTVVVDRVPFDYYGRKPPARQVA